MACWAFSRGTCHQSIGGLGPVQKQPDYASIGDRLAQGLPQQCVIKLFPIEALGGPRLYGHRVEVADPPGLGCAARRGLGPIPVRCFSVAMPKGLLFIQELSPIGTRSQLSGIEGVMAQVWGALVRAADTRDRARAGRGEHIRLCV